MLSMMPNSLTVLVMVSLDLPLSNETVAPGTLNPIPNCWRMALGAGGINVRFPDAGPLENGSRGGSCSSVILAIVRRTSGGNSNVRVLSVGSRSVGAGDAEEGASSVWATDASQPSVPAAMQAVKDKNVFMRNGRELAGMGDRHE